MIQIDMEMPKSCSVCPMRHTCKVSDEWDEFDYCCNGRLEGCPLKEVSQEPILDKIRAEIMDTGAYEQETKGRTEFLEGINYCLGVIDKYKTESDDK